MGSKTWLRICAHDHCRGCESSDISRQDRAIGADRPPVSRNEVLTLALRRRASYLLSDDRLLRQLAVGEGLRPMGTLGILLKALERGLMTRIQARQWIEALVQQYQFRISIEVYDATLQRIERAAREPSD